MSTNDIPIPEHCRHDPVKAAYETLPEAHRRMTAQELPKLSGERRLEEIAKWRALLDELEERTVTKLYRGEPGWAMPPALQGMVALIEDDVKKLPHWFMKPAAAREISRRLRNIAYAEEN